MVELAKSLKHVADYQMPEPPGEGIWSLPRANKFLLTKTIHISPEKEIAFMSVHHVPVSSWEALTSLAREWRDADEFKAGLFFATLFTIAVLLIRHYVTSITLLVSAGAWYEYGHWAVALGAIVPASYETAYVALMMRAGGVSTLWKTWKHLKKAKAIKKVYEQVMYQLKISGRGDHQIPPLVNVRPSERGVTGEILTGSIAYDAHDLTKLERKFASGFFCDRVTIRASSPSMATVSWEWGHHLREVIHAWNIPKVSQRDDKPALAPFGIQDNGDAAVLVSNLSTLVGGVAGAGKSSTIWAQVNSLRTVAPIRLRIVDPSGVEFAAAQQHVGNGLIHDYISDPKRAGGRTMDEFWEDLAADFDRRLDRVEKSGKRWHKPTDQEPLDVLIIDEILPLAPQLKKDPTEHIVGRILFMGRKAGFIVIAASQAGQVDVLGRIRDLFPQRICHRTKSRYVTDAFLGEGAEMDGARCSTMDTVRDQGMFYMACEGVAGYTACRSAFISDRDIERIVQNLDPEPSQKESIRDKPTSLYGLFGHGGELLYVGIAEASRLEDRWGEHARSKDWWSEVADMKELSQYPERSLAETAEEMMIKRERPKYNKQHNTEHAYQ